MLFLLNNAKFSSLKRLEMEKEILKQAAVDSIGQRNSYVKTWGCGGFLDFPLYFQTPVIT
ncbi:CP4-6 prophage; partial regulator of insertion element IS911A [Escherichia coli]|nr:CP4-6 prophage; partial regulator of insertion element IS911A [Escherichia coli]